MIKILVDLHSFDYNTDQGITTYLKGLYKPLVQNNDDIEFYFILKKIQKAKAIFGNKKNIHYIKLKSKFRFARLLFEIPMIIKKYNIDIGHFQYIAPFRKNCKTIVTLHDLLFLDYPQYFTTFYRISKKFLFMVSAKRADLLLTVSNYSKGRILYHFHISPNNIFITPNAVSDEYYNIDTKTSSKFTKSKGIDKYILYVSRFEPRKNQLALLRAYVELKLWEKGISLVYIGEKSLRVKDFDSYYNKLSQNVKQFIHIYSQVPHNELLYWYKSAELFVYPSFVEGFGIPPIEAGAAGVKCLCSNTTAMKDFWNLGFDFFTPSNIDELKQAIINIIENKNKDLFKIQTLIKNKYNWDNISKNYVQRILKLKKAY